MAVRWAYGAMAWALRMGAGQEGRRVARLGQWRWCGEAGLGPRTQEEVKGPVGLVGRKRIFLFLLMDFLFLLQLFGPTIKQ